MSEVALLRRYWNRRMDPLDWNRVSERHDGARWERACRTYLDPATRDALRLLGDVEGRRLLEIGCGSGYGTIHLLRRGASVTGIDVSDRRCAAARRELSAAAEAQHFRVCAAGAARLPFPAGSFDLVFCRDVLMYTQPEEVLADCHRVLVDGGRAVFVESLRGSIPLRLFRRLRSPRDYLGFTRHLSWARLRGLDTPLERLALRPYYLLSLAAFLPLFCLRWEAFYRIALAWLEPLDRRLLACAPALANWSWRAVAVYRKRVDALA